MSKILFDRLHEMGINPAEFGIFDEETMIEFCIQYTLSNMEHAFEVAAEDELDLFIDFVDELDE